MTYLFETEEHAAIRAQVRRFAERAVAPHAGRWEEDEEFPRALYDEAAAAGVLGIGYPEALGGGGGDLGHLLVASDELIVRGRSVGTAVGLGSHGIALPPIVRFGSPAQQARWVTPALAGRIVAALAITEPGGGSDVAALTTRAVRDGDHYVVDGAKTFITSGCRADVVVTAVRTGGPGHGGISLLAIERGTPGFSVSARLRKMGWWASDTAELTFDGCRVPVEHRIGPEHGAFAMIMMNFAAERLMLASQCVAIAELATQEAVSYCRARQAFGKPLTGFQVTRHKLADMATQLAAARALVGEALVRVVRGEPAPALCAMAKNAATDMVGAVVDAAVQLHGGMGYMRETLVERLYRDARLYAIGGGTREIMNEIIGKTLAF
ncbi:MAG: acyl-CoA dehydrogenase family protein [Kofleriaceae bacterium]|jgi:acyl-CoA dehydrogenase|nr:acyl-CoA dehydrogenase family protein [Kofleriaceae bacterium]MBP6837618.1 acyl-CoA dehydrogenase family protein [Kofleriaceae bacterium]MBP9204122.1 acyl-CoA dehydrogenase family protein [Kofleriaceae bacterium]